MSKWSLVLIAAVILVLAASLALSQPPLKVEFYFPHYYNPTFKAQTNEQVIISKGYKGRGSYYGAVYITNEGGTPVENIVVEVHVPKAEGFEVLRPPKGGKVSEDKSYFTYAVKSVAPGKTVRVYFSAKVPETYIQKVVTFKVVIKDTAGNVIYEKEERRAFIPPPALSYALLLAANVVVLGAMFYLVKKGKLYGRSFKTKDIIYTAIFGVLLVIWVQVIGRSLGFFALTNRLPIPYVNYAIGDIGYATLFVLGVLLVRKPGVATLMLLIYDIVSEIFWYGINPLWWLYPVAEGVPVDLYLAFINRVLALKRGEEPGTVRPAGLFGAIDAAIIGGLRPLFAWTTLYYVFFPYLNHYYTTSIVVFLHTTTITVFNMIFGAFIAYPLYKVLEKIVP